LEVEFVVDIPLVMSIDRHIYRISLVEFGLLGSSLLHELVGIIVILRRWMRLRKNGVGSSFLNAVHTNPKKRIQVFTGCGNHLESILVLSYLGVLLVDRSAFINS